MWCNSSIQHLGCWGAVQIGHLGLDIKTQTAIIKET